MEVGLLFEINNVYHSQKTPLGFVFYLPIEDLFRASSTTDLVDLFI